MIPAIDGTLRVLRAAEEAKVNRIVLTSSKSAMVVQNSDAYSGTYDESNWSTFDSVKETTHTSNAYSKSKTAAEQAAWKFAEENKDIELVSIKSKRGPCTRNWKTP